MKLIRLLRMEIDFWNLFSHKLPRRCCYIFFYAFLLPLSSSLLGIGGKIIDIYR